MLSPKRAPLDLAVVLAFAALLAAAVVIAIRPSIAGNPIRLNVVYDIMAGKSIAYTPYPAGYPLLAAFSMRIAGLRGLSAAQGVLYVLTVLFSYLTLAGFGVSRRICIASSAAVALYPNLLFAITRFVDTVPSCFLIAAFAWLVMRLRRDGLSLANSIISGIVFAAMLLFRPNAIMLAPIALWAAWSGRGVRSADLARAVASCAIAIALLAAAIVPLKGRLSVFDRYYGAYTFANGTHQYAAEGIIHEYNGEMAMPQAMREQGLTYYALDRNDPALADMYMRMGWQFIHDHPVEYIALEGLKVANLFRPDYRNVANSFVPRPLGHLIHGLIAVIALVWIVLRWIVRREYRIADGLVMIPMVILYIAPFVATNTDPRYRVPLDVALLLDLAICVSILVNRTNKPLAMRASA